LTTEHAGDTDPEVTLVTDAMLRQKNLALVLPGQKILVL
jgi:hypothetical protein